MGKKENNQVQAFLDEVLGLFDKYEGKITQEEMTVAIQSVGFTMVLESTDSLDETGEILHETVDLWLDGMEEELSASEDSTITVE